MRKKTTKQVHSYQPDEGYACQPPAQSTECARWKALSLKSPTFSWVTTNTTLADELVALKLFQCTKSNKVSVFPPAVLSVVALVLLCSLSLSRFPSPFAL